MNPFNWKPTPPANKVELLIDADYLSYMVGSLSQHKPEKRPSTDCEFVCLDEDTDTWVYIEPEGLVNWKIDNEISKLLTKFDTDKAKVYLTGEGNFREDIAVTKPYKGTRQSLRPYYFNHIRRYLTNHHGAKTVTGYEADDEVSIQQTKDNLEPTIIVSNDKDLKNTPGYLYSSMKDELYFVSPRYARYHFWWQMVIGDSVDNIPGIPGRGQKWLEKVERGFNDFTGVIDEICWEYQHKDKGRTDLLHEQGNLLHMLRYGDQPGEWEPTYDHLGNEQVRQGHLHRNHEVIIL